MLRLLNLLKCLIYHTINNKIVCLRRVWIRLTTANLLCAREFRHNNTLVLQFWCLSNALTLRVRALDASKSQRACIILSKFTRKSKYTVINLYLKTKWVEGLVYSLGERKSSVTFSCKNILVSFVFLWQIFIFCPRSIDADLNGQFVVDSHI